jgi:SPP1 family phage portal protein
LKHAFYRNLVLQKVGYSYKNKPQFISEIKEIETVLDENGIYSDEFHTTIIDAGVRSSNDGATWLHPFANKQGELEAVVIESRYCIPIYDNHYQKELTGFIRFYPITIINSRGDESTVYKAEWWTDKDTTYYVQDDKGNFWKDTTEPENPKPHFAVKNTATNKVDAGAWGKVPFVKVKNNLDEISDFRVIKALIDSYDKSRSDMQNVLEDLPDALIAITGAEGENAVDVRKNLKTHKLALLGDGQRAERLGMDVPKDAREYHDKQLKDDIFENSQGVHFGSDKWGNSPYGITLKFMFAPLDIKADMQIAEMKRALKDFLWFVFRFDAITNRRSSQYDNEEVQVKFTKSVMVNDKEQSEIIKNLTGIISQRTQLEQIPFIEDVDEEMKRLKEEKAEKQKELDKRLDSFGGNDDIEDDEDKEKVL